MSLRRSAGAAHSVGDEKLQHLTMMRPPSPPRAPPRLAQLGPGASTLPPACRRVGSGSQQTHLGVTGGEYAIVARFPPARKSRGSSSEQVTPPGPAAAAASLPGRGGSAAAAALLLHGPTPRSSRQAAAHHHQHPSMCQRNAPPGSQAASSSRIAASGKLPIPVSVEPRGRRLHPLRPRRPQARTRRSRKRKKPHPGVPSPCSADHPSPLCIITELTRRGASSRLPRGSRRGRNARGEAALAPCPRAAEGPCPPQQSRRFLQICACPPALREASAQRTAPARRARAGTSRRLSLRGDPCLSSVRVPLCTRFQQRHKRQSSSYKAKPPPFPARALLRWRRRP